MKRFFVLVVALASLSSACSSQAAPAASPNVDATVQAAVQATVAAVPTTPPPTQAPSAVPAPTVLPTAVPSPQPTAAPTPVASIPPRGAYKHPYTVTEKYDRITDVTDVVLKPDLAEEKRGAGSLMAVYTYRGTHPAKPANISFSFVSLSDDWQYLQCHSLSLLLDGKVRMPLDTTHDGDVGRGYVLEFVQSRLPLSQFLQIVNAKQVEGRLCNTQFALSSAQMEALRDLASRMQP